MTIAELVERRRADWNELEELCAQLDKRGKTTSAAAVSRFATLYRSACADLALTESYQLAPETAAYLHRLVARCHAQLYRSRGLQLSEWFHRLFVVAPRRIFADNCVRVCAILFYGLFLLSMVLARAEVTFPNYAESLLGSAALQEYEEMYDEPMQENLEHYLLMSNFYIKHNTSIGLRCFAEGILILPCLYDLCSNAVNLGAVFGYLSRDSVPQGDNFLQFVTAHGPFELTAIVLSAAAGLRLGLSWIQTARYRRMDALKLGAIQAVPVVGAAAMLFVLAGITEGFLSPSPAPYLLKALWSVGSSGFLMFYFVVLGFSGQESDAA